jgi:predicted nucleic acid-binding protein
MLLDSNIIIYSAIPRNVELINFIKANPVYYSRISYLEVLGFHKLTHPDKKYFEKIFASFSVLEIDADIILKATDLRQMINLSLGDAIIAATSILYNLSLITNNEKDFKQIKNLKIINPLKSQI